MIEIHNSLGQIKAIPKALQNMKSQISQTNNADVRKETDQGFANLSWKLSDLFQMSCTKRNINCENQIGSSKQIQANFHQAKQLLLSRKTRKVLNDKSIILNMSDLFRQNKRHLSHS